MKKTIFCLVALLTTWICYLHAQKQNNQWRFGTGGGIDFNTLPPVFVPGSQTATGEGSASVADRNSGALLFYTDGVSVWNANNQVMPNGNGLLGGTPALLSSTTAAVIVPKPGSNTLYYIITIDEQSSSNGVRYSLVDMTLNGGLGDVVATEKNISIFQTSSEKLEVVPASDGVSYWLITHDNPGNSFYAFKITAAGIQLTPVISTLGGVQGNGAGHMKISRQFDKIAMGNFFTSDIELFDFNNTTGIVSNEIIWNFNFSNGLIYGVEFSPDGSLLYVSNLERIVQYNISQLVPADIENSAYQVTTGFYQAASLQLAVDDKIYVNSGAIDVINCPNKSGSACGFQQNVIANQTGGGGYGLPKWIYYASDTAASKVNKIVYTDTCFGNSAVFSILNTSGITNVIWNFGDPASGSSNTATGLTASHSFSQTGIYTIQAILTNACGNDTLFVNSLAITNCTSTGVNGIKIVGDTCNSLTLDLQVTGTSSSPYFFWDFDDPASGTNDTVTITGVSSPPFPTHTFSAPGVYTVCVTFQEPGLPASTICRTISIGLCCNGIIISNDTCLQNTIPFSIVSGASITAVTWNFGDPASGINNTSTLLTPSHLFSGTGSYIVTANIAATCGNFQINYPIQIIECSNNCTGTIVTTDSCLQNGISFQIISGNTINSINWNFGDPQSGAANISTNPSPSHLFSSEGIYTVSSIVNFTCGTDTLSRTISVINCDNEVIECPLFISDAFTPDNDGINDTFYPVTACMFEEYECLVYNRWGIEVFNTSEPNVSWDGEYKGTDCSGGVYYYIIRYSFPSEPLKTAKGTITLFR